MTNNWDISDELRRVFDSSDPNPTGENDLKEFAQKSLVLFVQQDMNNPEISHCLSIFPYDSLYNNLLANCLETTIERMDNAFKSTAIEKIEPLFFAQVRVRDTCRDILHYIAFLSQHCPKDRGEIAKSASNLSMVIRHLDKDIPFLFHTIDTYYEGTSGITYEYDAFLNYQSPPIPVTSKKIGEHAPRYLLRKIEELNDATNAMVTIQSSIAVHQIAFFSHALELGYYSHISSYEDMHEKTWRQAHSVFKNSVREIFSDMIKIVQGNSAIATSLAELVQNVARDPNMDVPRPKLK